MSKNPTSCYTDETAACCCIDIGTVIDNRDCQVSYEYYFSNRQEAEAMLTRLIDKARAIESEVCQIESQIMQIDDQTGSKIKLIATFLFCCQAENMIFQLALR